MHSLLGHDFEVRAASRHPERVPPGTPGLHSIRADIHNKAELAAALEGSYGVINAVSLYVERGGGTFRAVHVDAAARLARLAREAGVEHLVHVEGASRPLPFDKSFHRDQSCQRYTPRPSPRFSNLIRPFWRMAKVAFNRDF